MNYADLLRPCGIDCSAIEYSQRFFFHHGNKNLLSESSWLDQTSYPPDGSCIDVKRQAHEEHKRSTNMSREGIAVTSQPFFSPTFFVF